MLHKVVILNLTVLRFMCKQLGVVTSHRDAITRFTALLVGRL